MTDFNNMTKRGKKKMTITTQNIQELRSPTTKGITYA